MDPVSNSRVGIPLVVTTSTDSEKETEIEMESPTLYVPSGVDEVTLLIVGAVVSAAVVKESVVLSLIPA